MKTTVIWMLFGLLAGLCCTSQKTCSQLDWIEAGRLDVQSGGYSEHFRKGAIACQREGQLADLSRYQSGKEAELATFCTPENAYEWGRAGRRHFNDCPASQKDSFEQKYSVGLAEYRQNVEAARLRQKNQQFKDEEKERKLREEQETHERMQAHQFMNRNQPSYGNGTNDKRPLPSVFDRNQ